MQVVDSIVSLRSIRQSYTSSVAFVPTMGALHEGHLSLIRLAKKHARHVIVSIFVNPTQFGPTEDFDTYPRTREQDLALLAEVGVDLVLLPTLREIYPHGPEAATKVYVPVLGRRYCGQSRPLFFEGVCSVVLRLFHIVNPTHALFGEKDFQQLTLIRQLVEDLYLPIQIVGGPILREPDGLAMSSRNRYLTPQERVLATAIYATLSQLKSTATPQIKQQVQDSIAVLEQVGIVTDYLTLVHEKTLEETEIPANDTRLLFAGYVGNTRLIDNISLGEDPTFA
jgi:pantoate--beta-alanine ligase